MKDFSASTFKYNGKKYTFTVRLFFKNGDDIILDNNMLECFEYENEFNGLVHRGSITYIDELGKVDRCIGQYNVICQVMLIKNDQMMDGELTIEQLSPIDKFIGLFIVDNVEILSRESSRIKYKLDLVSSNIYKCLSNIDYSNYSRGSESCLDIIKNCAKQKDLGIDKYTFDNVNTKVKIDYITNGNDNFISVVKYMFGKMYYYDIADNSMKFIFLDELRNAYRLFDVKNINQTTTGNRIIVLSPLKSNAESIISEEPIKLGMVTKFSQTDIINTFSKKQMSIYDYVKNAFNMKEIGINKLQNYYNEKSEMIDSIKNTDFGLEQLNIGVCSRGSYWNNDFNIYGNVTRCLLKNNALIVETFGDIQCIPGCIVTLCVDREYDPGTIDNPDELKDQINRYLSYEGVWYAVRVRSYIRPPETSYRQVLTLVRNFTPVQNSIDFDAPV